MEHRPDDIETLIMRRAPAPQASKDLSERIIHAAMASSRPKTIPWTERLRQAFILPVPRMAMAAGVVALLAVAFSGHFNTPVQTHQEKTVTDYEFTMVLDVFDDEQSL